MKRKKGFFSISAVANMLSVHQQTIRLYEKEGLITPKRTPGGTRMFSDEDLDKLEEIIHLTHKLGINIAGVEMILKLKKQMKKMQDDMNKMFNITQQELDQEIKASKEEVRASAQQLLSMKHEQLSITSLPPSEPVNTDEDQVMEDVWEVEYDE